LRRLVPALRGLAVVSRLLVAGAPLARAAEPEEPSVRAEEVVVHLPRAEASADPTASVTVVDATRFAGEAKDVAALVATAPGVAVEEYGGLGHLSTVSIRGATSQDVKVLVDGIPLNAAAGGGVDLSSIPAAWIERIEVLRGAEGAHYGTGALGGVVNVVTKRAAPGAWSLEASGGSFMTLRTSGDYAAGGERWAVLGAATGEGTGGWFPYVFDPTPGVPGGEQRLVRANDVVKSGGGLVKAWTALGEGRADALVQVSALHRGLPGFETPTPYDWESSSRLLAVGRVAQPLAPSLFGTLRLTARRDALDTAFEQALGSRLYAQRELSLGATAELAWLHGPGTLTASASAGDDRLTGDGYGTRSRPELAAAVSEDLLLLGGRLRLAPALRVDRVGPYTGVSGKLGATARLAGPLSARASAGRSFRPPSFGELFLQQGILDPNPDLRPEEAWTADAGLVAEGDAGLLSATAFASLYRDLIVYEPGSFGRLRPYNDGKVSMTGFEVEAASAPLPRLLGLSGALAYTYLLPENLRGIPEAVGDEVPYHPRHRAYARIGVEQRRFGAHVEGHWVGKQFRDLPNIPGRFFSTSALHAGGFVRLAARPDLRVALEVKNLLDNRTLKDAFNAPLPSRTVLVTVRLASPTETP